MQNRVQLQRERNQGFGAAAMLLRLMQIYSRFEGNRSLGCERTRPANILIQNRTRLHPVEDGKHPQCLAGRAQQGNRQELANFEGADELNVRTGNSGCILGEKDLLLFERADRDTIGQRDLDGAGTAVLDSPANAKNIALQKPDVTAPEA